MTLASIADYEAITGQKLPVDLNAPERVRVERLLAMASDAVLAGAYGQQIAAGRTEALRVDPFEGVAYLPQRPVIEVEAVTYQGELLDPSSYTVQRGGSGRPASISRPGGFPGAVTVTYRHGFDPIPGPAIAIVCAMAATAIEHDGGPAPNQEAIGPFSASWSDAQAEGMALTAAAKRTLRSLFWCRPVAMSLPVRRDQP